MDHFVARGGMATVYRAHDLRLQRSVALKVMHPALAEDPEFVRRFVREARSAAQLTHPAIVAVYDQGETDELVYLAMEFVDGRNLRDVIAERGRLDPATALGVLEQVLDALGAAHTASIVHRDIKPENILLACDGRVKVADFGLARAIEASTHSAATAGLLIGTVAYLAPEQVERGTADARADVYAAGIVLFECLTGTTPYSGETPLAVAYQHVHGLVPAPSSVVGGIPRSIDELVQVATHREPARRYSDAIDFGHHIRTVRPLVAETAAQTIVLAREVGAADPMPLPPATASSSTAHSSTALLTAPVEVLPGDINNPRVIESGGPSGQPGGSGSGPPRLPMEAHPKASKPPRRHRRLVAAMVLMLLAAGAGAGAWVWGASQYTDVPSLIGLSPAAATEKLKPIELSLTVDGQDFSEDVPKGMITNTDPGPGGRARDNTAVHAHTSKGPERHQVPVLRGMTAAEAVSALTSASLKVGTTKQEYDDKIAADHVISSSPEAASSLKRDTTVNLVASKGPAPVDVPKTIGLKEAQATKTLTSIGLKIASTQTYSDTVPNGTVISSSPQPGASAHRGDTVTLTVSKGPPPVPVPRVTGMSTDDARARLQAAGFRVSVVNRLPVVVLGRVYSQSPGGGDNAPRGSTITITIV